MEVDLGEESLVGGGLGRLMLESGLQSWESDGNGGDETVGRRDEKKVTSVRGVIRGITTATPSRFLFVSPRLCKLTVPGPDSPSQPYSKPSHPSQ